jgi:hypothetical protein
VELKSQFVGGPKTRPKFNVIQALVYSRTITIIPWHHPFVWLNAGEECPKTTCTLVFKLGCDEGGVYRTVAPWARPIITVRFKFCFFSKVGLRNYRSEELTSQTVQIEDATTEVVIVFSVDVAIPGTCLQSFNAKSQSTRENHRF